MLGISLTVAGFDICKNGKATSTIILRKNASPSEILASRELQKYFEKISDAKVKINGSEKNQIILTTSSSKDLDKSIKKRLEKCPGNDSFYLKTIGNKLYIAGKKPIGTLYGAYTLLNKIGVRWFYPRELGEDYIKKEYITVKPLDDFEKPDYKERTFGVWGSSSDFKSTFDFMVRNKMQVMAAVQKWQMPGMDANELKFYREARNKIYDVGGHVFSHHAVPKSLFKNHPEYFALKKGKRVVDGRINRCLSNPAVVDMFAHKMLERYRKDPDVLMVFIGQDAADAFCECENCKKLGTYNGKYSVTTLFHSFFKKVSDKILKEAPDAKIHFYAYWNYRDVPPDEDIKYLSKNSRVVYCSHQRCHAHKFSPEQGCNKKYYDDIKKWFKRTNAITMYQYGIIDAKCYYAPFEYMISDDIKTFKRLGIDGWLDEIHTAYGDKSKNKDAGSEYHYLSNWQSGYVASKMLWDSSLNIDKLMNETYDRYYRKAAPVMKKYHAFRHKLWDSAPGHAAHGSASRTPYCLNVPGSLEKLEAMLVEAEKLAVSDKVKKRIAMDKKFLKIFWEEPQKKLKKLLSQKKEIVPAKAVDKIVIDGKLNETTWLKAPVAEGFINPETKQAAVESTAVRIAYDDKNIYVAVNADNKHAFGKVCADAKKKDGKVWNDDSIEIQIVPPKGKYYHIMANTIGTIYDAVITSTRGDSEYNSHAQVKVRKHGTCYNYEFKIPLKPMGIDKIDPSQAWKIQVMRTTTNLTPPTNREWSSFDGVRPYKPILFRKLVFGHNYIRNPNFNKLIIRKYKDGTTYKCPEYWEYAGDALNKKQNKIIPRINGNNVWYKTVIYTGFRPEKVKKGKYCLTVKAKGKGRISVKTWSWKGYNPRVNHRRLDLGKYKLTPEFKNYTFRCKVTNDEDYIIFYIYGNDITLESVNCIVKTVKNE
jgi:hypothetical protein